MELYLFDISRNYVGFFHPPALIIASLSNPRVSKSCAAPTRVACPLKDFSSSFKPVLRAADFTKRIIDEVSNWRSETEPVCSPLKSDPHFNWLRSSQSARRSCDERDSRALRPSRMGRSLLTECRCLPFPVGRLRRASKLFRSFDKEPYPAERSAASHVPANVSGHAPSISLSKSCVSPNTCRGRLPLVRAALRKARNTSERYFGLGFCKRLHADISIRQ